MAPEAEPSRWQRFYEVVARIPPGHVATYGQIARLAGLPRHARQVGYALAATPKDLDVPWHRVINARGEISARAQAGIEGFQRHLLEEEGILFVEDRVSLKRFGWNPEW